MPLITQAPLDLKRIFGKNRRIFQPTTHLQQAVLCNRISSAPMPRTQKLGKIQHLCEQWLRQCLRGL